MIEGRFTGATQLGYNEKEMDLATGWYNYGFRDYSPVMMRFTTVDPIRDGTNWYAFVGGDPVNYVDLFGLDEENAIQFREDAISVAEDNPSTPNYHTCVIVAFGTAETNGVNIELLYNDDQSRPSQVGATSLNTKLIALAEDEDLQAEIGLNVEIISEDEVEEIVSNLEPGEVVLVSRPGHLQVAVIELPEDSDEVGSGPIIVQGGIQPTGSYNMEHHTVDHAIGANVGNDANAQYFYISNKEGE